MTIYTRSYNSELFAMMREFIPEGVEIRRMENYNTWEDALRFIEDVIKDCEGIAVIMDEDCFPYDFNAIPAMIDYMLLHGYTHAGMPDRGVSPHRTLQWTTINPFFNILDCATLRRLGGLNDVGCPNFMAAPTFEIFDNLYLQMWKVGKPLFLNASTLSDGLTTHLMDHNGEYFALHSWMSREWVHGERNRILDVYNTAKEWKK